MVDEEFKEVDLSAEKKKIIREITKIDPNEILDYSKTIEDKPIDTTTQQITKKETFWTKLIKILK